MILSATLTAVIAAILIMHKKPAGAKGAKKPKNRARADGVDNPAFVS